MGALEKALQFGIIAIAREFFVKIAKETDPYTTKKSEIVIVDNEIILLTPSHIQFAKYGRGPGKNPPRDAIMEWVKSNSIQFAGLDSEGTASAIQFSIGAKGTKNWVQGAPNAMEEAIKANVDEYNKELNNTLQVEIRDNVDKEYAKVFPPKVDIKL